MGSRVLVWLMVLLVSCALSGCLDDSGTGDPQETKSPGEEEEEDPGPGAIRGRVTGFEGPMVEARVDVSRVFVSTLTDEEGRFSFDEVPPGEYRVSITMDYYHRTVEQVQVKEGEEVMLEVELELRMMTEEVPMKYGKRVQYLAAEDTVLASAQFPVSDGAGFTVTNQTMNHTFPGFWAFEPEPDWLVAQLDVLVAWTVVDEHMPSPTLGIRYFRGEGPAENEIVEGEATQYHAPVPDIDYHLARYYKLKNDDWLTWGPRDWQVGVVVEDFDDTLPGGAAVPHIVQVTGVLVATEYAETVS